MKYDFYIYKDIQQILTKMEQIPDVDEISSEYFLPSLYKIDAKNKERVWQVWTKGNTVYKSYGLVGGKKQIRTRVFKGKNLGKKNETSAEEQAQNEADSNWTKQLDKGYKPKCKEGLTLLKKVEKEKEKSGGHNINAGASIRGRKKKNLTEADNMKVGYVETKIIPMKASEWLLDDRGHLLPKVSKYFDFDEGVYLQWKLDGFRCIARPQDAGKVVVFTSNSGREFPWLSHLREEVSKFVKGREDLMLDGLDCELYAHCIYDEEGEKMGDDARFSTISSICSSRRTKPHPLEDQMCLYIFDLVDLSGDYDQDDRFSNLKKLFRNKPKGCDHLVLVKTRVANFPEEIFDAQDEFVQEGYEGVIIRARNLIYESGKRSLSMRKYKSFIDEEWTVVDVSRDKGVGKEYFVWVCEREDENGEKKRVKAKPMGTDEERVWWYEHYLEFLGRKITIKYQNLSDDGIPRFPVAKGFRPEEDL